MFVLLACVVPLLDLGSGLTAAAAVYKCTDAKGSTSYSDVPCDPNAERVETQSALNTHVPSAARILSAVYVSPRNGKQLDVTNQLRSACSPTTSTCVIGCNNGLAGDPDFGQRKFCRIAYQCTGGAVQDVQIQEGQMATLVCRSDGHVVPNMGSPAPKAAQFPSQKSSARAAGMGEQSNQGPFKDARCSPVDSQARHRTPVDLYGSFAVCAREGKYDIAVVTFALAGVYGRFDTYRVADKTAHQAVGILKDFAAELVPPANQRAFTAAVTKAANDPARLRELCRLVSAVGYPLYEPTYMQAHGMAAFIGSNANATASHQIDDLEGMWRKATTTYLNCP